MTSVSRRSLVRDRALPSFDVRQARNAVRDARHLPGTEMHARETLPVLAVLAALVALATKLLVGSLQPVLQ